MNKTLNGVVTHPEMNGLALVVNNDRAISDPKTVERVKLKLLELGWYDNRTDLPERGQDGIQIYLASLSNKQRALVEHSAASWTESVMEASEKALYLILYDTLSSGRWAELTQLQAETPYQYVRMTLRDETKMHRTRLSRVAAVISVTHWLFAGGIKRFGLKGAVPKTPEKILLEQFDAFCRAALEIQTFITEELPKLPKMSWNTLEDMVNDGTLRPDKDTTPIAYLYRKMQRVRVAFHAASKPGASSTDVDKALAGPVSQGVAPLTMPAEISKDLTAPQRSALEKLGWVKFTDTDIGRYMVRYKLVVYPDETFSGDGWASDWRVQWEEEEDGGLSEWFLAEDPGPLKDWEVQGVEAEVLDVTIRLFTTYMDKVPPMFELREDEPAIKYAKPAHVPEEVSEPMPESASTPTPDLENIEFKPVHEGVLAARDESEPDNDKPPAEMVVISNPRHTFSEIAQALDRYQEKHGKAATLIQVHADSSIKPGLTNVAYRMIRAEVKTNLPDKLHFMITRLSS